MIYSLALVCIKHCNDKCFSSSRLACRKLASSVFFVTETRLHQVNNKNIGKFDGRNMLNARFEFMKCFKQKNVLKLYLPFLPSSGR